MSEAGDTDQAQIGESIAAVLEFYAREQQKLGPAQRTVERISHFFGRPGFLWLLSLIHI